MAFDKKLEQINTQAVDSVIVRTEAAEFRPLKPSQLAMKMAKRFSSGKVKAERIRKSEEAMQKQGTVSKETLLERLGKNNAS